MTPAGPAPLSLRALARRTRLGRLGPFSGGVRRLSSVRNGVAAAQYCVACRFRHTRGLSGHAPGGAAHRLAGASHGPARLTADILHRAPGTTAHVLNGPPRSLPDILRHGADAPAHVLDSSPGALPHVLNGPPGSLTDILYGGSGAPADLLDGPSGTRTQLPHCLTGSAADILHSGPDSTRQLVQDLRVAVESGEHSVDDLRDVVETHLELGLCLDTRDAQVHLNLCAPFLDDLWKERGT
ncbi:hypothetical protein [Streptomyces sp. NBC_01334]|uniref:hypothetical protein n=1 Tax=Streptomyces sp. NBC_01334 TaxID=2903827 RepID=UPI002E14E5D8|nr:hypothetical protein OG736_02385 [Streptomyces sp. NBC_01334]